MELIDISTERTTAATDIVLTLIGIVCATYLYKIGHREPFKRNVWCCALALLAGAAALGTVAHGIKMSESVNNILWQPLNLSLGLAVALFAVGVIYDMWGRSAARRILPVMISVGVLFYVVTLIRPGSFTLFIVYEAGVMMFALGAYALLTARRRLRGSGLMTAGILVTIAAAGVQTWESVRFTLIWEFDRNGLFHLIQSVGVLLLTAGLRAALHRDRTDPAEPERSRKGACEAAR